MTLGGDLVSACKFPNAWLSDSIDATLGNNQSIVFVLNLPIPLCSIGRMHCVWTSDRQQTKKYMMIKSESHFVPITITSFPILPDSLALYLPNMCTCHMHASARIVIYFPFIQTLLWLPTELVAYKDIDLGSIN